MDEKLEQLHKMLDEGNVVMANEAPTVCSDGHTKMFAEALHDFGCVSVGLQDGGGFSSMFMVREQWGEVRQRIDALFDQLSNG